MNKNYTILIADDEPKIVDVISEYLRRDGFQVLTAASGEEALALFRRNAPSLVVLDLMLPDISGEDVCAILRSESSVPILMLTAKHLEVDLLRGLSLGADDYVTKPCSPKEVVARVRAILRRTNTDELLTERLWYSDGALFIDAGQQLVSKNGAKVPLTASEYRLLLALCRNPGRVFSRIELVELVFGIDFQGDFRTIDAHIKNLRSKIERDPKHPQYVETVYGVGYRFGRRQA
ncbi:response regulator transcription factor [Alicyclobacillus sp. SO9]|uniref:response regulator transcription factor n=1 Tax=Alicyclobacillus sp. SO9 TaxID=2665646 RepID=UPI0018E78666|nr:response regulator transcription factor [Alicyclobacillus sp. SO9]QQE78453.1 response regulator transcription factor [Alicyclobacillus sp. SO9]